MSMLCIHSTAKLTVRSLPLQCTSTVDGVGLISPPSIQLDEPVPLAPEMKLKFWYSNVIRQLRVYGVKPPPLGFAKANCTAAGLVPGFSVLSNDPDEPSRCHVISLIDFLLALKPRAVTSVSIAGL